MSECKTVTLRTRPLKKGMLSFYLDYYPGYRDQETMNLPFSVHSSFLFTHGECSTARPAGSQRNCPGCLMFEVSEKRPFHWSIGSSWVQK